MWRWKGETLKNTKYLRDTARSKLNVYLVLCSNSPNIRKLDTFLLIGTPAWLESARFAFSLMKRADSGHFYLVVTNLAGRREPTLDQRTRIASVPFPLRAFQRFGNFFIGEHPATMEIWFRMCGKKWLLRYVHVRRNYFMVNSGRGTRFTRVEKFNICI